MILSVKNPNNLPLVDYRTIANLQGDLKTLSNENYHKIVHSLNKYGFFVPLYIWINPQTSKLTLLDGHGRLKVLIQENAYTEKGNTLLPYLVVEADTIEQAKEKLLIISSQYHTITEQGLSDFSFDLDKDIFNLTNFDALQQQLNEIETQNEVFSIPDIPLEKATNENKNAALPILSFGKHNIHISEIELDLLENELIAYKEKVGSTFGFVSYLINRDNE